MRVALHASYNYQDYIIFDHFVYLKFSYQDILLQIPYLRSFRGEVML